MNDNETGGSERFVVPKDALGQRHSWFHRQGCNRAPEESERVGRRGTRLRGLEPCPECDPVRTQQGTLVQTDGGRNDCDRQAETEQ